MRGDFSRLGPRPDGTVTGVWLQQGRPLLDADWNDLQQVLRGTAARTLDALLGGPAGPAADLGFEVQVHASLALNLDGAKGQRLTFERSPSLPFAGSAEGEEEEDEHGDDDGAAARPRVAAPSAEGFAFDRDGDRPSVIEVDLRRDRGAAGLVLRRPGQVAVGFRRDGSLWLGGDRDGEDLVRCRPTGRDVRVCLVNDGRHHRLFVDGEPAGAWSARPAGDHPGPALAIGGDVDGTGSLACRLDAVRIWRVRRRRGGPAFRLVADLDLGRVRGRSVHDRTPFDNGGRIEGERPPHPGLDLRLGAGRYFVGGMPLVNRSPCPLSLGARPDARGVGLVYLRVEERTVGALEEPALREVALGGADTVVHTRSAWRAEVILKRDPEAAWAAFDALSGPEQGRARFGHAALPSENGLYRVEVHHAGWAYRWPPGPRARTAAWRSKAMPGDRLAWPSDEAPPEAGAPLLAFCGTGGHWVLRVADLPAGGQAAGEVAVTGGPDDWPEDDVHLLPLASFKWSPANAAAAYGVEGVTEVQDPDDGRLGRVQLASAGFNGLDIRRGDWVELSEAPDAERGALHPVTSFDRGLLQVDLGGWEDGPAGGAALLRRWGPAAEAARGDGGYPPVLAAETTRLDPHVSVRFRADVRYAAGDAWTLPLREAEDDVSAHEDRETAWLPAESPVRAFAPLALVRLGEGHEILDLRRSFRDLPALTAEDGPRAPRPERRIEPGEAARWLARHMPGVHLVGSGPPPPGFREVGSVVSAPSPKGAPWHRVGTAGRGPRGPGRAVSAAGGMVFLEEGTAAAWRWTEGDGWVRLGDQPDARLGFSAVAVGGGVAVVGGSSRHEGRLCETIDILLPGGDWTRLACDATPGFRPAAAMSGRWLHVTGGVDDANTKMSRCEAIDLRTGETFERGQMRLARADHAMAAVGDTCLVFGGVAEDGRETAAAEAYDGALDRWRPIAPLAVPCAGLAAAAAGPTVVVGGGSRGGHLLAEVATYMPDLDRWAALTSLPEGRRRLGLAAEPAGHFGPARLLAVGGEGTHAPDVIALSLGRRLSLWVSEEEAER